MKQHSSDNSQVFDVGDTKGAFPCPVSDEMQRNWSEHQWQRHIADPKSNYDRSRAHLNFEVTKGGIVQPIDRSKSVLQKFLERCQQLGIDHPFSKIDPRTGREIEKKNHRTTADIIYGGSREIMLRMAFGDQEINLDKYADNSHLRRNPLIEQWARDIYRFTCDEWGEDNIIGFYVHLDEMNPHIHCVVMPVATVKGKPALSFNKAFWTSGNKKTKCRACHDRLAIVNKPYGLRRGQSVGITGAKHRSTEQYRRDLRSECSRLEREIESGKEELLQLNAELATARRSVKGLQTMILNLKREQYELEREAGSLNREIAAGRGDVDKQRQQLKELQMRLSHIAISLDDKEEKLTKSQTRLDNLEAEIGQRTSQRDNLVEEVRQLARPIAQRAQLAIKDVYSDMVMHDYKHQYAESNLLTQSTFDGTFIQDMAERGTEVMKCAGMLFAGYVEGAINYAISQGGGGGSNDTSPWGRRENEDDRDFAHRCLLRAYKMMKPTRGYGCKR